MVQEKVFCLNGKEERLAGILTLPSKYLVDGDKFPLLIICHGFGQAKDGKVTGGKFAHLAMALAQKGIAVFRFDFSGHGESEGSFENLSIQQEVDDLRCVYNFLMKDQRLDMSKVALLGHSLGALIAVIFQAQNSLVQCLILVSPAIQQRELIVSPEWHTKKEIEDWGRDGYLDTNHGRIGIQYLNEALSKDWSEFCREVNIPVLMLWGGRDKYIPQKLAKQALAEFRGGHNMFEVVAGADHHFEDEKNKKKLIESVYGWLFGHLVI